jgi:hypothetical protein
MVNAELKWELPTAGRGVARIVLIRDCLNQKHVQSFGMSYLKPQASFDYRKELNNGICRDN